MSNHKKTLVRITTVPQSLWKLLEGQLEYMTQYYEVVAISSPGDKLEIVEEREKVRTYALKMNRGFTIFADLWAILKLIILLRKLKPTIVHTHTPKAGLVGMIAAKFSGVPIRMHTVAGLPLESRSGFRRSILLWAERLTYRFAGMIYPNSRGIENFIKSNKLAPDLKIKMIGQGSSNGIDLGHFKMSKEMKERAIEIRRKLNIDEGAFVLGFIGRLVKDKGIVELIVAYRRISKLHNCHLLLVGKYEQDLDPLPANILNEIDKNPTIHFLGYQNDVRPYFASFDIFTFPSYREGLPNVLLQAGAMGLPIVASNCTGNTDIIKHKENGLLVGVGDVDELYSNIEALLLDDEIRKKLSHNVETHVRNNYDRSFLWRLIKEEYDSLLNE